MWRVNPLKIHPDLSPLFIIWLNCAEKPEEVVRVTPRLGDEDALIHYSEIRLFKQTHQERMK